MPTLTRLGPIEGRLTTDEAAIAALQADVTELQTSGIPGPLVVEHAAVVVGSRPKLNLIEQAGVQLTVTDDPVNNKIDVTIQADLNGGYF